jgi:transcriptional regulator with XRE-family HTH domain
LSKAPSTTIIAPKDLDGPCQTLARNLFAARTAMNMSQDQLAEAAGISRATVVQLESGEGDPRLSTLAALATALTVSPVFFLFGAAELNAIANMRAGGEAKLVRSHISKEEQDIMRHLLRSGLPKNRTRAVKMGASAAVAAGLTAGAIAGAAIGTAALPVIGTAIGAALGSLLAQTRNERTPDEE